MFFQKKKLSTYIEILIHLFLWIYPPINYIMIDDGEVFIGLTNRMDGSIYVALVVGWVFNPLIFYGNALWLAPKYLSKAKYLQYLFWTTLFFSGLSGLEYLIDELIISIYGLTDAVYEGVDHIRKLSDGPAPLINGALLVISLLYRFSRDWVKNELLKRELIEEKLATELKFLKSQINPHFLFNTLNNLYGMALKEKVPVMADNINKLSGIMRYMLYESNADKVPLSKEIEYIKNFIEIQKLRFSPEDKIDLKLEMEGELNNQAIVPMILIPFVENAFKHGIDLQKSSYIFIKIIIKENELVFHVKNSNYRLDQMNRTDEKGIGLENVKRRLELLYPEKHELKTKDKNEYFEVNLELSI